MKFRIKQNVGGNWIGYGRVYLYSSPFETPGSLKPPYVPLFGHRITPLSAILTPSGASQGQSLAFLIGFH